VKAIQELFSDLGVGFIEACLQYYEWDPARVTDAIVDNTLPPVLHRLPRDMKRSEDIPEFRSMAL